jgi:hypothetical protein
MEYKRLYLIVCELLSYELIDYESTEEMIELLLSELCISSNG